MSLPQGRFICAWYLQRSLGKKKLGLCTRRFVVFFILKGFKSNINFGATFQNPIHGTEGVYPPGNQDIPQKWHFEDDFPCPVWWDVLVSWRVYFFPIFFLQGSFGRDFRSCMFCLFSSPGLPNTKGEEALLDPKNIPIKHLK